MKAAHLAREGLVSHCELDQWTGVTGHFFTRLQKKKKVLQSRQHLLELRSDFNKAD